MEIERKFLIDKVPDSVDLTKCKKREIEQAYLCTNPVIRPRRDQDDYYITYKGAGLLAREEYNLALNKEAYESLIKKCDGIILSKTRYEIPEKDNLTIELDIFKGVYEGLILAEVEFESIEQANAYIPPAWFGEDVTSNTNYSNSTLSKGKSN